MTVRDPGPGSDEATELPIESAPADRLGLDDLAEHVAGHQAERGLEGHALPAAPSRRAP